MCDVPFKPTTGKPIYCRDCFAASKGGSSNSRMSYSDSQSNTNANASNSSGISQEQFSQLNSKLDQILEILQNVEFVDDSEEGAEESEEESEK